MAEQFNCPSCGAPLDYDGSGNASMRCPFCSNTVLVPEALRAPPVAPLSPAKQAAKLLWRISTANEHLFHTGLQATAKVLQYMPMDINKVLQTVPMDINPMRDYVAVTLIVEVHPKGRPAFTAQAEGQFRLAMVPKYQPGQKVTVRYDPNDLTKVAVEPFFS